MFGLPEICGIVAAAAGNKIVPVLVGGLKKLECRGYDSAVLAVISGCGLNASAGQCTAVLSESNANPHVSGAIAVVHNGVIENYGSLRRDLTAQSDQKLYE